MSRTRLCAVTAAILAAASFGVMAARTHVLGREIKRPGGSGAWKVTLLVEGRTTAADARVTTPAPLDFGRQHVYHELCRSAELVARPRDARRPDYQPIHWVPRPGLDPGPFRLRHQFYCTTTVGLPTASMMRQARQLAAGPGAEATSPGPRDIESDDAEVSELARRLTDGVSRPRDQVETLYRHVAEEVGNEPDLGTTTTSALDCLRAGTGDAGGKARLLVALCRNRGIPARLVTGVVLQRGADQPAHVWAEARVDDHWLPACPSHGHLGRVPTNYFVLHVGEEPLIRGRHVRDLRHALLVERVPVAEVEGDGPWLRGLFRRASLSTLPPAEQHLCEFLLLLPVAALIVCLTRNVIGLVTFGTFAPALLGLAFRDLASLPGILVFVALVLAGWLMRRWLDRFHLLQVPRVAVLLTLVVAILVGLVMAAGQYDWPVMRYVSLFPLVILTGMIERFWTVEAEDGTTSSFRTLAATLAVAAVISLTLSLEVVVRQLTRYPETLGLIAAAQLLLGRYTGYRLTELFRFRDFVGPVRDV
jgi:hypothetical protein